MNQVEYNLRHSAYTQELRAIEDRYGAERDAILAEAGSDEESIMSRTDEVDSREEEELNAAREKFLTNTAGPIS
jgi:hypothetical protein